MIEAVRQAMVMSAVEMQDAATFLAKYAPQDVDDALAYTKEHASRPNWPYLKSVLKAKPRRITMDDYATFSPMTQAKLDRFANSRSFQGVAITGLEKSWPDWLPEYARKALEG